AVIATAEAVAAAAPGVSHAHARARSTGRTLRVEVEGWLDPATSVAEADATGRLVAQQLSAKLRISGSFVWAARSAQPV
ncbi:cation diffusion facilitator family transporter, partial [Mycobacterium kansasii]